MANIDLVTANEFTFTPSAFIAAYIENAKDEGSSVETTTNGGTLSTIPGGDGPLDTTLANAIINANKEVATAAKVAGFPPISAESSASSFSLQTGGNFNGTLPPGQVAVGGGVSGVSPGATTPTTISGAVVDFLGQRVTDTRTTTKSVTSSFTLSVVLVLSYGTFKSPAENRAGALATVALIYSQVGAYLSSL